MKSRPVSIRRKQSQGGFILLIIFMMAGAIALSLYAQLPRIAFESEREKEQILIDRGEQYIRAIQLYLTDTNRWPQSIEDLEKGNNKRYLRRRYIDPYTGKDEWRLIHTNGSQLTDSLVEKPPTQQQGQNQNASNAEQQEPEQVNAAVLARPSDVTLPGAQTFSAPTQGQPAGNLPPLPNQVPGQPGFGVPGQMPSGVQLPGNVQTGVAPQFPGQQIPGQQAPGQTAQIGGAQFPGQQPPPGGFQPQFPGQQFPGQQPPAGVNVATNNPQQPGGIPNTAPPGFQIGPNGQLIPIPAGQAFVSNNLPTANAAGVGLPGANTAVNQIMSQILNPTARPPNTAAPQNNAVGGGGIAGVASTHTGPSIKAYKERNKYQEWEFVFKRQGAANPTQTKR